MYVRGPKPPKTKYALNSYRYAMLIPASFRSVCRRERGLWFCALLVLQGTMAARGTQAAAKIFSYTVQGTLTYSVPGYPTLHRYFEASVSNCLWSTTIILAGKTDFWTFEQRFDGTNTIEYFTTNDSGGGIGSGIIERGSVPEVVASDCGAYVWLAYASGCYFHDRTPGTALSLKFLRSRHGLNRRYLQRAEWTCSSVVPFLPIELTYIATNLARGLDENGHELLLPLGPDLAPGYAEGRLRCSSFAAFGALSIPREFHYVAYGPKRSPAGKLTVSTNAFVHGVATNISGLSGFPLLPSVLHLEDERVPEPAVMYKVTNALIPGPNSAFLTNVRNRALSNLNARIMAEQHLQEFNLRNWLAVALVLMVVAAPGAYLALRRKRSKNGCARPRG